MNKIYLLNLKRRPEKLQKVKKELKKHGLLKKTEIVYGVDGLNINKKELIEKNIIHKNFERFIWNAGTLGSIGNYLSFAKIFEKIKQNSLLLEDDIILHPQFEKLFYDLLHFINSQKLEWDVIYFGISNVTIKKNSKNWSMVAEFNNIYKIYDPCNTSLLNNGDLYGMFGLYITPKAAKLWLDGCFPMKQASDSRLGSLITGKAHTIDFPTLFQMKEKKLKALVIYPNIINYSNIISDTSL